MNKLRHPGYLLFSKILHLAIIPNTNNAIHPRIGMKNKNNKTQWSTALNYPPTKEVIKQAISNMDNLTMSLKSLLEMADTKDPATPDKSEVQKDSEKVEEKHSTHYAALEKAESIFNKD